MSEVEAWDIETAIDEADLTEADLEMLMEVLRDKHRKIARRAAAKIAPGDRVRLKNLKPKYLSGAPGEVLKRVGGKFQVRLDASVNTRRYSHVLMVPMTSVERIGG